MHELSDEEKLLNKWLSRDHEGKRQYVYGEMVLNERIMCAGRIPPLFGGTHCPAAFARQAIADEPWTLVWKSKFLRITMAWQCQLLTVREMT